MIPAEAVEAAALMLHTFGGLSVPDARERASKALEAALPILLSHERELTRLAHLDAMVNRETKRAELAEARAQALEEAAEAVYVDGSYVNATWLAARAAAERRLKEYDEAIEMDYPE